ncbi:MAG TPA: amidohydrolase family protein [Longimicrobium sp.]|nr:amidohydrolase family protein [Longimicrobium sp.]
MRLRIEAANASVGVADGVIVAPDGEFDVVLRVPDGEVRPGLINAHDHLHRNHYGRLGDPPYANAYAWGRDLHARHAEAVARGRALPRREALLRGAWKNLFAGVTTVVHHDRWEDDFEAGFPLRVVPIRTAHSLGFEPAWAAALAGSGPLAIHLAEGTDALSADEVRELARRGLLDGDLLAVHVVGADADGVARLRAAGAAVVWCPSSNLFLFGRTAPRELLAPGIDVLLGSDSLLTGDGTLLDEIHLARRLGLLSDERLLDAVGAVAARRLGIAAPSLDVGARADLAVFRRPVLEAGIADVAVVVAAGVPRVLDPALAPALGKWGDAGHPMELGGTTRWTCDGIIG